MTQPERTRISACTLDQEDLCTDTCDVPKRRPASLTVEHGFQQRLS
jgi:hypothetical protein